jgi:polar amino acid transport system substrate-binding protein
MRSLRFTITIPLLFLLIQLPGYAGEKFVLGAEDQAGPWGRSDGMGCGNDIVKAAFAASGDTAILMILPYARAKQMAVDGKLEGCFAMSWMTEFKGKIIFAAKPIYKVEVTLLTRHDDTLKATSLADLPQGSILGLVKDYEYHPEVRMSDNRNLIIEEVASEQQNLKKLAAGRIRATVVCCDPLKSFHWLLKQAEVEGKVDSAAVVGIQGSYVGFSLKKPSGVLAKKQFDKGMAIIKKNGTYDSILKIWLNKCNQSANDGIK